jgi:drug/metabolite transporter (DMT)-like permease
MFWVPIWGVLLLGEKVSGLGTAGIGLILFGAYSIQLRALAWSEMVRPFRNLRDPAVLAALAAGFIYSVGAVIDKTGVMLYSPFHFTALLVDFMLLFMTLNIMRPKYRGRIMAEFRISRSLVILSGPVIMASFLSFRYGLQLAPMSYAVPVRQVSLLIGVLIGVLFLGEACGRIRFIAALLILCGAALIRFG